MRLIDADALQNILLPITTALEHEYGSLGGAVSGCMKHIDNAPTVDAVEVVRCKDCQKCLIDNAKRELHLCMKRPSFPVRVKLDGFCSDGDRKDLAAVAEELNWLQKPAEE